MKTAKTSLRVVAGPVILVALVFVCVAYAATSVVQDPSGDVGASSPDLDVVHAQVVEQQGTDSFLFMMSLANSIAEEPSEGDRIWPFHVDTNRLTAPGNLYNEFVVRVRWFRGAFVGQVIDRRPLLSGGAPILTSIPFSIDGRTVKAFVPRESLGDPASFRWNAATRPGATAPYADFAPDAQDQFDSGTLAIWAR